MVGATMNKITENMVKVIGRHGDAVTADWVMNSVDSLTSLDLTLACLNEAVASGALICNKTTKPNTWITPGVAAAEKVKKRQQQRNSAGHFMRSHQKQTIAIVLAVILIVTLIVSALVTSNVKAGISTAENEIKEAQAHSEELRNSLKDLKSKNEELNNKVADLETELSALG